MDDKDLKILHLLQENARLPLKTLAGKVGLARSTVRDRIARLEADGVISGYKAKVAWGREGQTSVKAFLVIRLKRTPARETVSRIVALPNVRRCVSVSGDIDVIVEIEADTIAVLNEVRDDIALLPDVADVTTAFVLKDEKPV